MFRRRKRVKMTVEEHDSYLRGYRRQWTSMVRGEIQRHLRDAGHHAAADEIQAKVDREFERRRSSW